VRDVTERDLRDPKYGMGEPEEFEFRDDGSIARKDRWEMGIRRIATAVGARSRDTFEIDDVVSRVKDMADWLASPSPSPNSEEILSGSWVRS